MDELEKAYIDHIGTRDSDEYQLSSQGFILKDNSKLKAIMQVSDADLMMDRSSLFEMQKDKEAEDDTRSTIVDIGIGSARGGAKLIQGAGQLIFAGLVEAGIADEENFKKYNDAYNKIYDHIGDTQGVAGGLAEGLIQYGIPGVGYYNMFNRIRPTVMRALAAEAATVGTVQVQGDPNLATFFKDLFALSEENANNLAQTTFVYLATPNKDLTAHNVFEDKFKAIITDSPLAGLVEVALPLFRSFANKKTTTPDDLKQITYTKKELLEYERKAEIPENPFLKNKTTKPSEVVVSMQQVLDGMTKAKSGKDWYLRHKTKMKDLFGDDADLFEEIVAITSQNTSVDENISKALKVYEYFKEYGTFANARSAADIKKSKVVELLDENEQPTGKFVIVDQNIDNIDPLESAKQLDEGMAYDSKEQAEALVKEFNQERMADDLPLVPAVVDNLKRLEGVMDPKTGDIPSKQTLRERMGLPKTTTSFGIETYFGGNKIPDFVEAMRTGTDDEVVVDRHMLQYFFGFGSKAEKAAKPVDIVTIKQMITDASNELGFTPKEGQAAIWAYNQMIPRGGKTNIKNLDEVRDYAKVLNERADEIEQFVNKLQNIEGQGESIQAGSRTDPTVIEDAKQATDVVKTQVSGQLYNFIRKNPDGFTNSIDGKPSPITGYSVAPLKKLEIVKDSKEFSYKDAQDLVKNIFELNEGYDKMGLKTRVHAGGWLNEDDGKYYLDAVVVTDSLDEALAIAKAGDQIAVADLGAANSGRYDEIEIKTEDGINKLKESGSYRDKLFDDTGSSLKKLDSNIEETRVQNNGGAD